MKQPALIIALLQSFQPGINDTSGRVPKKPRKDVYVILYLSNNQQANLAYFQRPESGDEWLSRLSFLSEILSSQKLPGSSDLVSALLDTLNRIVSASNPAQAETIYTVQIVMACLESSVSQIEVTYTLFCSSSVYLTPQLV